MEFVYFVCQRDSTSYIDPSFCCTTAWEYIRKHPFHLFLVIGQCFILCPGCEQCQPYFQRSHRLLPRRQVELGCSHSRSIFGSLRSHFVYAVWLIVVVVQASACRRFWNWRFTQVNSVAQLHIRKLNLGFERERPTVVELTQ